MKRNQRAAVLALLIRRMLSRGSWCGETHVQKATFFLQELMGVDLGFSFVLYRHGPFSFELRDELSLMQADDLISLQVRQPGYGPALVPTQFSDVYLERFPKTLGQHQASIEFIANELGGMNVAELERIATAFFIAERSDGTSVEDMAQELVGLKPHISIEDALQAFEDIERLKDRAKAHSL